MALAALARFADSPPEPEERPRILAALGDARSPLVAKAARIVSRHRIAEAVPAMLAALARAYRDPTRSDPGCNAKEALVEALDALDHPEAEPFLTAARHVQLEAAWGPPVDTATHLRARGVAALANLGFPDLLLVAGPMLGDPEVPVRTAAADALAHHGDRLGAGCLLLAARRDPEPGVRGSCLEAALRLAPEWTLPILEASLGGSDPDAAETAALVLGGSHREDALDLLLGALEDRPVATDRLPLLRALALHRSDRALEVLASRLDDVQPAEARTILEALAPRAGEPRVRDAVTAALSRRGPDSLGKALAAWT